MLQVSPIATMSPETWHFSFAKYLELRFYGHAYCRRQLPISSAPVSCACVHPLHTEHFHYFGCRDLVASFKYAPIQLKEIVLAPAAVAIRPESDLLSRLIEDIRQVAQHGHGLYASLADWLQALVLECNGGKLETQLASMVEQQVQERTRFRKRVEEIQLMLTSPNLLTPPLPEATQEESLWLISDHLVLLKRIIADTVCSWNGRLHEIVAAKKKEDKAATSSKPTPMTAQRTQLLIVAAVELSTDATTKITSPANSSREDSSSTNASPSPSSVALRRNKTRSRSTSPNEESGSASPFVRNRSSSEFLHPSAVEDDPAVLHHHRRRSSSQASTEVSMESGLGEAIATATPSASVQVVKSPVTPSQSRLSLGALLSAAGPSLLTSPFPPTEHHLLPPGSSLPLVVYQNEPSSIIAYALSSVDYEQQLAELQADLADQLAAVPSSPPRTSSPVGPDRWFDNVEREEPG